MTHANDFLMTQVVDGTSNQLNSPTDYLDAVVECSNYIGESEKNGNEVMTFKDGSIIVRIEDEAFDYNSEEDYR